MRALLAIWVSDIYLFKFIMKIHSWAGDGEKEGEGALHNGPVSGDYFRLLEKRTWSASRRALQGRPPRRAGTR